MQNFLLLILSISLILSSSFAFSPNRKANIIMSSAASTTALKSKPFAIMVEAEIKPNRMEEFLDVMERDAVGSREEPGCLRFGEFTSYLYLQEFIHICRNSYLYGDRCLISVSIMMKDIAYRSSLFAVIRQFGPFPFPHWIRSTIPHSNSPFTHSFIYLLKQT